VAVCQLVMSDVICQGKSCADELTTCLSSIRSLYPPGTGQEAPEDLKFKLMVAVNKCDLLPSQATEARVNVSHGWDKARIYIMSLHLTCVDSLTLIHLPLL
jgi:hypothetical protein